MSLYPATASENLMIFARLPRLMIGLAGLGLASSLLLTPARAEVTAAQRVEIQGIIKDYLLKNPDVLRDALAEMERKQKADEEAARSKAVADQAPLIFNSPRQAVLGNPNGKVTLVEFFDYNCGYCKKALDDLAKLVKEEPELRVVIKDFPVLGPGSVEAAEVATALRNQLKGDKYWQFHQKLLATKGQVGKAQALAAAKEFGVDMAKLEKDMIDPATHASIQEVMQIADTLQLTGTPSYVVADDVVVGAVGYDALKSKIESIKKCGKSACG
jgi:protein-disulfide isomerase